MDDRIREIDEELNELNSKIKVSRNRMEWLRNTIVEKQNELDEIKFNDLLFMFNIFKSKEIHTIKKEKEEYKLELDKERKNKWELEHSKKILEEEKQLLYTKKMKEVTKNVGNKDIEYKNERTFEKQNLNSYDKDLDK